MLGVCHTTVARARVGGVTPFHQPQPWRICYHMGKSNNDDAPETAAPP
jgi:hypothetical protein